MGQAPVVYGQSDRPPRGDYARAREDYTCEQNWQAYSAQDHDTYHRLYQRQSAQLPGLGPPLGPLAQRLPPPDSLALPGPLELPGLQVRRALPPRLHRQPPAPQR